VRINRIAAGSVATILAKLEFYNPAHSVKDRIGLSMIVAAEAAGKIHPDTVIVEPTSGNTGIALAMAAALRGYKMLLLMPDNLSVERRQSMAAYGADILLTPKTGGMEYARDLAEQMQKDGRGIILDQFANEDNSRAHYESTGPEIWRDTNGQVTHFVSAMGTTGTIMGVSRYLKEQNPAIQIIGAQPEDGSQIPGIRKWPEAYLPKIYDKSRVDQVEYVSQAWPSAWRAAWRRKKACSAASRRPAPAKSRCAISQTVENATIVFVVCDRGDRYLSTGVFPA